MPTPEGRETIAERLTRLRARLVDVRATIDRSHRNGASFNIAGSAVTQIALEHALREEKELQQEIADLEARIGSVNGATSSRVFQAVTRMP